MHDQAAQMQLVRARAYRVWGDYLIQQAHYKDPKSGHARDFWQVVRRDGRPMPSGRPVEIFGRKKAAESYCQAQSGKAPKVRAPQQVGEVFAEYVSKDGTTKHSKKPVKLVYRMTCGKCGNSFSQESFKNCKLPHLLCLDCWKQEQNAINSNKARQLDLPNFTTGTTRQKDYAVSVRQQFVDKMLVSLPAELHAHFLNLVRKHIDPTWWLDHNDAKTLMDQFLPPH